MPSSGQSASNADDAITAEAEAGILEIEDFLASVATSPALVAA